MTKRKEPEVIDLERQGDVFVPTKKPSRPLSKFQQPPAQPDSSPLDLLDGVQAILTQAARLRRKYGI